MPKSRKSVMANVLGFVAQARAAASKALQSLRAEIGATRKRLETHIAEERSFRLDLFGAGRPGRPRGGVKKEEDQEDRERISEGGVAAARGSKGSRRGFTEKARIERRPRWTSTSRILAMRRFSATCGIRTTSSWDPRPASFAKLASVT
jgi:hypothetical protein